MSCSLDELSADNGSPDNSLATTLRNSALSAFNSCLIFFNLCWCWPIRLSSFSERTCVRRFVSLGVEDCVAFMFNADEQGVGSNLPCLTSSLCWLWVHIYCFGVLTVLASLMIFECKWIVVIRLRARVKHMFNCNSRHGVYLKLVKIHFKNLPSWNPSNKSFIKRP